MYCLRCFLINVVHDAQCDNVKFCLHMASPGGQLNITKKNWNSPGKILTSPLLSLTATGSLSSLASLLCYYNFQAVISEVTLQLAVAVAIGMLIFSLLSAWYALRMVFKAGDIFKVHQGELPKNGFEIYISYKKLSVEKLSNILRNISECYGWVLVVQNDLTHNYDTNNSPSVTMSSASRQTRISDWLKCNPEEQIYISFARTGDSIRIHIVNGWKPSLINVAGEVSVGIPKNVLVFSLILYGLISAIEKSWGLEKLYYEKENQKNIYYDHKKSEHNVREWHDKFLHKLKSASPDVKEGIDKDFNKLIAELVYDDDIKSVKLNSRYA